MGELEKYLESRERVLGEPSEKVWNNYSLRKRYREVKSDIEGEWGKYKTIHECLLGETVHGSDMDKLIYYLVKKGIP